MTVFQQFLLRLREATQQKRLNWAKNSNGEFVATGKTPIIIRQIVPLVAGPTETIGPQGFEVQAANVSFSVWDGTEACDTIREILAYTLPEWATQREQIAERLTDIAKEL